MDREIKNQMSDYNERHTWALEKEIKALKQKKQMSEGKILFKVDGRPVYYGNILFHPDKSKTGGLVTAEFEADGDWVTVRSENGAVPKVMVENLCWNEQAISERYCPMCGKEKETK